MSTRAYIFTETDTGSYKGIYTHFDGYFSGVGATLYGNYNDKHKVDRLIQLGDLSALGATIEPSKAVKRFGFDAMLSSEYLALPLEEREQLKKDNYSGDYTIAYHRDRQEEFKQIEYKNIVDLVDNLQMGYGMIEYIYLFINNKWFYLEKNRVIWHELGIKLKRLQKKENA